MSVEEDKAIVLVEDSRQQREAETAGADVVLLKGFRGARLRSTIEELLWRESP